MSSDSPLYLHFLDRELGRSVDFHISPESAEHIVKCLLIGTTSRLYCGLSLAWESHAIQRDFALFLPTLLNARSVDLVSHHSTLGEFMASRESLYRHDQTRYPMYFERHRGANLAFRPTHFKSSSTTLAIATDLDHWAESGGSVTDSSSAQAQQATFKGIREVLLRRENQAVTYPLFEDAIGNGVLTQGIVRRGISVAYTTHYMAFGSGDIPTGIRGLEYFDHLSHTFPFYDVELLWTLLQLCGVGSHLDKPWTEDESWWQRFLAVRGEDATHAAFRLDLKLLIRALHATVCKSLAGEPTKDLYAARHSILAALNGARAAIPGSRCTSGTRDFDAALECVRNLVGYLRQDNGFAENWEVAVDQQKQHCDLLLVVTTEIERDAVLESLGMSGAREVPLRFGSRRTYFDLGLVGGAHVLLVQSEMGSGSPGASLQTVGDALDELRPLAVIMVGLAFGIDSVKQQIGDLTVSHQLQCYDLQRIGTSGDGSLQITPRGDRVTASTMLSSRLRAATVGWTESHVEFGLVLSGEKLVDNVEFRNQLLVAAPEAISGEMEGAGLYSAAAERHVDWIIVKGICDWADGKKRFKIKERQVHAARNAAAFVIRTIRQGGFSAVRRAAAR